MTKDSLIKGTIILTLAALIARFLGIFHRIPLVHLLGDSGMGSYTIAFNLYQTLLVIATAGIPAALSKLISEKITLGLHAQAEQIYRAAIMFSMFAGILMSTALYVGAPFYASNISGDPQAILATRAIAPALLLFPLIAIMRGYFQGRQHMLPNGISQVVEQCLRTIVGIGLAYVLLQISKEWAVAGASLGAVAGSVAALAVMIYYMRGIKRKDKLLIHQDAQQTASSPVTLKTSQIYRNLIQASIPIVIFSVTVTFIYNLDSSTIIPLLKDQYGKALSLELIGILGGRAQSLAGIPLILAIAISQSIVPIISAAYSKKDVLQVSHHTTRALQLCILSGLPVVLMISLAAKPLDVFLFGYEDSAFGIANGSYMIALLTIFVMFQIVQQTSGAVMIGMGRVKPLVWIVAIGIAVKFIGNFVLSHGLGIYGIILSTGICFFVISWLILHVLKKEIPFTIFGKRWFPLIFSTTVIVGAGLFIEKISYRYIDILPDRLNQGLIALLICGFVIVIYPILIITTRVITKEDISALPAPIQKWVKKFKK